MLRWQKSIPLSLKIGNGIEGFDDFWYGCQISTELSVLTSNYRDIRDKVFVYNNFYTYQLEEHISQAQSDFFTLKALNEFDITNAFHTTFWTDVQSTDTLLKVIKKKLRKREYVYAGVDLFYLLPGTYCYKKFHWMHYTFVTGYDILKKEFYVLEHTAAYGYRAYTIPEERFEDALQNCNSRIKVFVKKIKKNYSIKEYQVDDLVKQAKRLIDNLQEVKDRGICLFKLSDIDYAEEYYMDLSCQEIFVIMNHMKANKRLFVQLFERGLFASGEAYQKICEICDFLIQGWNCAKISLAKIYKTSLSREECVNSLNRYIKELFRYEKEMWEIFVGNVKGGEEDEKTD